MARKKRKVGRPKREDVLKKLLDGTEFLERYRKKFLQRRQRGKQYTAEEKEEIINLVLPLLEMGYSLSGACKALGLPFSTIEHWALTDEALRLKIDAARLRANVLARSVVLRALRKGDKKVAMWWLERREREDFATKQVVEHEGEMVVKTKEEIFEAMQNGIKPENENDKSTPDNKTKEHD